MEIYVGVEGDGMHWWSECCTHKKIMYTQNKNDEIYLLCATLSPWVESVKSKETNTEWSFSFVGYKDTSKVQNWRVGLQNYLSVEWAGVGNASGILTVINLTQFYEYGL